LDPVTAYLGLGSNLGRREENIRSGLELLARDVTLEVCSSIYDTAPWGFHDQGRFLNCVCRVAARLEPRALLKAVKRVEGMVGRRPTFVNGPRTIDVDILLYGDRVVSEPGLEIPHPRMARRAFVVIPLEEIAPALRHPVLGCAVSELARRLDGAAEVGGCGEDVRLWGGPIPVLRIS
jgi:2-amino-4-hydroxy-6-hydroxymethyldihydropteridine diphosphokinase